MNIHEQPPAKRREKAGKSGPKAETLVIEGVNWKEAVKRSFQKEKPPKGWPKPQPKKKPK